MKVIITLGLFCSLIVKLTAGPLDTWTNSISPGGSVFGGLASGDGLFTAGYCTPLGFGKYSSSSIVVSADGVNWANYSILGVAHGIAWGNEQFAIATANSYDDSDSGFFYVLTNGTKFAEWNLQYGPCGLTGVAFGNGNFITVGHYYEGSQGLDYVGTGPGPGYTTQYPIVIPGSNPNMPDGLYPTSIAAGNGLYVVAGYDYDNPSTNYLRVSTNGINWKSVLFYDGSQAQYSVSFLGGRFYLKSINGKAQTNYYVSSDPLNFSFGQAISGPIPQLQIPIAGGGQIYLTPGAGGTIYFSSDLTTWQTKPIGFTNDLYGLAYNGQRIVAAGAGGQIFSSGNLSASLAITSQTNGELITLTSGLSTSYHLQTSIDLITWTNLVVFTNIAATTTYLDIGTNVATKFYRAVSP